MLQYHLLSFFYHLVLRDEGKFFLGDVSGLD